MKILLVSFLTIIIPQVCAGWTYTQDSETFKQKLIREYPILAGNGETVSFEDIQDRKTRIHQISAKIKAMDSLVMLPYDENLLSTADQVTEQIPESFDLALYAASLYDILRAYCFDDSIHPDSSYTKLYNLFKELAEIYTTLPLAWLKQQSRLPCRLHAWQKSGSGTGITATTSCRYIENATVQPQFLTTK